MSCGTLPPADGQCQYVSAWETSRRGWQSWSGRKRGDEEKARSGSDW